MVERSRPASPEVFGGLSCVTRCSSSGSDGGIGDWPTFLVGVVGMSYVFVDLMHSSCARVHPYLNLSAVQVLASFAEVACSSFLAGGGGCKTCCPRLHNGSGGAHDILYYGI